MRKFILLAFLLTLFFFPWPLFAFTTGDVVNHGAPFAYFYQKEFDKLVLDLTIPSGNTGQSDILKAITLQAEGTAKRLEDFFDFTLWSDAGPLGFQGMAIDKKIGQFTFYYDNHSWYLSNLNVEVPVDGLRIFVALEAKSSLTGGRWLKARISSLLDQNNNGEFNVSDLGIYLQSKNNGPTDGAIANADSQTFRLFVNDTLPPKAVITNLENKAILSFTTATTTIEIKGRLRDQGGSSMQWVKIGITKQGGTEIWHEAVLGDWEGDEQNWSYVWQNIEPGDYFLRTKAKDWIQGEGISEQVITITIAEEEPEPAPAPEPLPAEAPTEVGAEEGESTPEPEPLTKQEQIASLKEQIKAVQEQIITLLSQLIEMLREQITG